MDDLVRDCESFLKLNQIENLAIQFKKLVEKANGNEDIHIKKVVNSIQKSIEEKTQDNLKIIRANSISEENLKLLKINQE